MLNDIGRAMRQAQRDWDAVYQPMIKDVVQPMRIAAEQAENLFTPRAWSPEPTCVRRRLPRKAVDWIMMRFTHVR